MSDIDEKVIAGEATHSPQSSLSGQPPPVGLESRAHDEALDFLAQHGDAESKALGFDPVYMRKLKLKIDCIILPFMLLVYTFNFIDKTLLNYGNVMGLSKALKLTGNEYSDASSAFWEANLVGALCNIYLVQRLPTGKWLGICLVGWSISTACTAATNNYAGLVACRVFSGLFEAVIPPAIILLTAQWYTRAEQASRFSIWYLGIGFGQIFGGLISWAFQEVSPHASLAGWRIMFIALGCITFVFSICVIFYLPDTPMQARFLSTQEKVALLEHIKSNQTGIEGKHFVLQQLYEALTDVQIWALFLIILLDGSGGGVITAYSATLIKSFGYTAKESALLLMGTGPVTMAATIFSGYGVRYFGNRWLFISLCCIPAIIGSCMMAWPSGDKRSSALSGIFLVNFLIGSTPVMYNWLTANVAGHTKRAYGSAMLQVAFAVGNIIGPQTFRAKDAPEYHPAKICILVFQSCLICTCIALYFYYRVVNARRNKRSEAVDADDVSDTKAYSGLTDKQNQDFRYVY